MTWFGHPGVVQVGKYRGKGMRLDYFFVDDALARRVVACVQAADGIGAREILGGPIARSWSDHCAVYMRLREEQAREEERRWRTKEEILGERWSKRRGGVTDASERGGGLERDEGGKMDRTVDVRIETSAGITAPRLPRRVVRTLQNPRIHRGSDTLGLQDAVAKPKGGGGLELRGCVLRT